MIWSEDRGHRRNTALLRVFATTASIAGLTACATREPPPAPAQTETETATAEPTEAASAPPAAEAMFAWPVPSGWKTETIPFPLGFAPTLPYTGVEELRFAPGMFTAGSDQLWTYAFVWWLEGDIAFDAPKLNADLAAYFSGLSLAVEERADFDPKNAVAFSKLAPAVSAKAEVARWVGTVSAYDAFVTHARIELNLDVRVFRCAAQDRTVALFTVSPQSEGHAVWDELAALRANFRCPE